MWLVSWLVAALTGRPVRSSYVASFREKKLEVEFSWLRPGFCVILVMTCTDYVTLSLSLSLFSARQHYSQRALVYMLSSVLHTSESVKTVEVRIVQFSPNRSPIRVGKTRIKECSAQHG